MQDKTVITISHRLNTILTADKIFVIKDGIVAEEGTHESLLAKETIYSELYHIQDSMHTNIVSAKISG
jgi:ABC-type multidrug transport system fused ATPase/permease subunit